MDKKIIKRVNISEKIKKSLVEERQRKLTMSLSELEDIRDDNYFVERYFLTCSKLLEEGYSLDEIEGTGIKDKLNNIDWKGALSDAAVNSGKEYAIRFILTQVFSANPSFATFLAGTLADINPLNLIRIFKGPSECNSGFPQIIDALLEQLVRYIAAGATGVDRNSYDLNPLRNLGQGGNTAIRDVASTVAGNMFGDIIRESDIGEKITKRFCEFIH
mgnify:CR=1 FL=1